VPIEPAQIATPEGHPVAVEEIKNLNGDFPPVVHAIAKLRRPEPTVVRFRGDIGHDPGHLCDGGARKKMVMRDLMQEAKPPGELQDMADLMLRHGERTSDFAHAWWTEPPRAAKQRADREP